MAALAHLPSMPIPMSGMPEWLRIAVGVIVVAATLVGIAAMIMAMRRSRDLQDGAPPLPRRPWSQPDEAGAGSWPEPGPPSPAAPDDATLERRLAELDDARAAGRIDASEHERARRALLGDDPDDTRS